MGYPDSFIIFGTIVFYMLIHEIFQLEGESVYRYTSEICTFILVISSSIAIELTKKKYKRTFVTEVVFPAYLIFQILVLARRQKKVFSIQDQKESGKAKADLFNCGFENMPPPALVSVENSSDYDEPTVMLFFPAVRIL